MTRYTLSQLRELPTQETAHDGFELKIYTWDGEAGGSGRKVWLFDNDGEFRVQVEEYDADYQKDGLPGHATPPDGKWVTVDEYAPEDDIADEDDGA